METWEKSLLEFQLEQYAAVTIKINCVSLPKSQFEGRLVYKSAKRRVKGYEKSYRYAYLEKTILINGTKAIKQVYIPRRKEQEVVAAVAKREEVQKTYKMLLKEQRYWQKQLFSYAKRLGVENSVRDKLANMIDLELKADRYRGEALLQRGSESNLRIKTYHGELVRSKNEAFVANLLYEYKIPYFYEKEFKLKPRGRNRFVAVMHPDFTIYVDGRPVYIEVLGMLGDLGYADEWERRQTEYKLSGVELGRNLICLICRDGQEINTQKLKICISEVAQGILPTQIVYLDCDDGDIS